MTSLLVVYCMHPQNTFAIRTQCSQCAPKGVHYAPGFTITPLF